MDVDVHWRYLFSVHDLLDPIQSQWFAILALFGILALKEERLCDTIESSSTVQEHCMRFVKFLLSRFACLMRSANPATIGVVTMIAMLTAGAPAFSADSVLNEQLPVADELKPLDSLLRKQLADLFAKRDEVASAHGRDSKEWFKVDAQYGPLGVHGERLLEYARQHPDSREALVCLCYIVDWGEGTPRSLCESTFAEIAAHHRADPAVAWLSSRCTNPLSLQSMEDFLTTMLATSPNRTNKAAAAYYLSRLYDNALLVAESLSERRQLYQKSGLLAANPDIAEALEHLSNQVPTKLANRRDELIKLIMADYPQEKPWSAERALGRLNYKFHESTGQPTFAELADSFRYELKHLRVGCEAPDFTVTDVDGRPFNLVKNRGKSCLVMFSFKGCGPCEATYPTIREI
jgi:hypothetical protein